MQVDLNLAKAGDVYYHPSNDMYYTVKYVSDEGVLFDRYYAEGLSASETYSKKRGDVKLEYTEMNIKEFKIDLLMSEQRKLLDRERELKLELEATRKCIQTVKQEIHEAYKS